MMYMDPEQAREWLGVVWAGIQSPGVTLIATVVIALLLMRPSRAWLVARAAEVRRIGWRAWIDSRVTLPVARWLDEVRYDVALELDALMPDTERRPSRLRALLRDGLRAIGREEARRRYGEETERL